MGSTPKPMRGGRLIALFFWATCLAAPLSTSSCGDDCVEVSSDCAPAYEPTFDNVYTNTLSQSCAVGSSCHSTSGNQGGLGFDTADQAYDALVGEGLVSGGDAACSSVIARLEADGDDVMPPGAPLSDAERCAVIQWVQNGAAR
jgi:Planctomycete cytochrome C